MHQLKKQIRSLIWQSFSLLIAYWPDTQQPEQDQLRPPFQVNRKDQPELPSQYLLPVPALSVYCLFFPAMSLPRQRLQEEASSGKKKQSRQKLHNHQKRNSPEMKKLLRWLKPISDNRLKWRDISRRTPAILLHLCEICCLTSNFMSFPPVRSTIC